MNAFLWFLSGAGAVLLPALVVFIRHRQRVRRRIQQLTGFLESVNCGRESTLPNKEDAFSLLEDELFKTVGELRRAKELAQKERVRQADNLADIAHQLKTPITSMSLMAQLLEDGADGPQRDCLDRLSAQLDRLEKLTSSLLTMSRLDAGAIGFSPVPLPFSELMARSSEPLEEVLRDRGQELAVLGGEHILTCDPAWTAEALLNLIKNCSEHSPSGGMICAAGSLTPLYFEITVEDNGPGFLPDDLPRLFRRFYRGAGSSKDSIGIGLALTRSILEEQNGVIRAENRQEGGARFILRFYHT